MLRLSNFSLHKEIQSIIKEDLNNKKWVNSLYRFYYMDKNQTIEFQEQEFIDVVLAKTYEKINNFPTKEKENILTKILCI